MLVRVLVRVSVCVPAHVPMRESAYANSRASAYASADACQCLCAHVRQCVAGGGKCAARSQLNLKIVFHVPLQIDASLTSHFSGKLTVVRSPRERQADVSPATRGSARSPLPL